MDIRYIKTFVRVAELKSFTKVANEMNYVQSTVTMQIQQLEKELGFPLFDRIGKKVSLTMLGAEFLTYAYEILQVIGKAENIGNNSENISGKLRIGVTESLMFGVLMDLLSVFKGKYKNLDLTFKTGHTTELIEELKHNQLDMVYISKTVNTEPDLICYYKRMENLVFISGAEHILAKKKNISFNELMQHNFVVTEKEGICYGRLREIAANHNTSIIDSVEVDSVYVITELVKKGMGLAFLPEYSVSKQLKEGSLVKLDVDSEPQTYYSQILCHKSRWISPFMAGFIDMINKARPGEL